jgi:hypothetical protein
MRNTNKRLPLFLRPGETISSRRLVLASKKGSRLAAKAVWRHSYDLNGYLTTRHYLLIGDPDGIALLKGRGADTWKLTDDECLYLASAYRVKGIELVGVWLPGSPDDGREASRAVYLDCPQGNQRAAIAIKMEKARIVGGASSGSLNLLRG